MKIQSFTHTGVLLMQYSVCSFSDQKRGIFLKSSKSITVHSDLRTQTYNSAAVTLRPNAWIQFIDTHLIFFQLFTRGVMRRLAHETRLRHGFDLVLSRDQ